MKTKNDIIADLYTGRNFNDCIQKMEPEHLREDLKSEIISIVCEWPEEKVLKLHEEKALEFYVVRVIINQIQSSSSPFHKKYRKQSFQFHSTCEGIVVGYDQDEHSQVYTQAHRSSNEGDAEEREERQIREALEDATLEQINQLYWYDAELIRLYLKHGNFRAIEKETGIPFVSCYKNIKKSLALLKRKALGENLPVFTKGERHFIQNNK